MQSDTSHFACTSSRTPSIRMQMYDKIEGFRTILVHLSSTNWNEIAPTWNEIPTKLRTLPKLIFKRKIRMILFNILESEDS